MTEVVNKKVEELVLGNRVDLQSCPYLKNHASAASEYGRVAHAERETEHCIVIGYEGIDHIGYPVGTLLKVVVPRDVKDRDIAVHEPSNPANVTAWNISPSLSTREGDLNTHAAESKPLELLYDNEPLLEQLREQMVDDVTFLARKDGQFGILFEAERVSRESEADMEDDPEELSKLLPHDEMVALLLKELVGLAKDFPEAQFCVPDRSEIINDRPAAWAFISNGALTEQRRQALANAMAALAQ